MIASFNYFKHDSLWCLFVGFCSSLLLVIASPNGSLRSITIGIEPRGISMHFQFEKKKRT